MMGSSAYFEFIQYVTFKYGDFQKASRNSLREPSISINSIISYQFKSLYCIRIYERIHNWLFTDIHDRRFTVAIKYIHDQILVDVPQSCSLNIHCCLVFGTLTSCGHGWSLVTVAGVRYLTTMVMGCQPQLRNFGHGQGYETISVSDLWCILSYPDGYVSMSCLIAGF